MSVVSEPVVIVVGGTDPVYRGYCVEGASSEHRLVLIDTAAPAGRVAELVLDHEVADTRDTASVLAAGLALAARHEIAGVLTWDEYALLPTAVLTERLGLRGNSVAAVRACRDKGTTRRLLAEAGVPSARSVRVSSREEAVLAAARIGYPVVLKPASHAASIGVVRVDTPEGFASGWEFAAAGAGEQGPEGSGVLVEEYLDGPEVSVECVTLAGETVVVAVTRKEIGFAPFFEEVGHTVTADDPLLPVVAPVARGALRALGVTDGVQHVEMRLTSSGPRIIEVNARIGGDWIGKLVGLATGLDLPAVATSIAADRTPDLTAVHRASAAVRIVYPPASGILTERRFPVDGSQVREAGWLREPGESVLLPPEGDLSAARIGYLITSAPTLAEAEAARRDAEEAIVLDVRASVTA
ncbi:ATP-grasp domain-containing protein [Streptomyces acidiscabies]|uniref:ATP-grasp domain-containing protein n=1 Tax=Streptomyces acidiscabies TaxID=42234 RepID=A0AAP6BM58_9ACTN|nr:ATP-grasp domain-containing protein [Streptomyces acidiscabies]MBP5936705.1 ATP-grasp domain-containing protein [Streptomyces sp. LBUM 1476]MBZ3915297.1 ATP-grasp domain-containing protein [Streptomyces acidiscabies]MDX2967258.1 ATP-grasp domain-containing protein [Streptomyces acidiscabies]MDX3026060.1 ATP-grasp domain-containing protein [Streptomyces acidiscabies]MDX3797035.1 ATP-grasp domain-containing protein [Streptomyces acidiscabies]